MLKIGPHTISSPVLLAPMAGITDLPFRKLCLSMGAGLATTEMITSDVNLWCTNKTRRRLNNDVVAEPKSLKSIQIVGYDPCMMARAAVQCEASGADIIDINFGCPAKKVCNKTAGSALLRDEKRVRAIIEAVICAVSIPVTIKIRTGWASDQKNGVAIAKLAAWLGISAIAVHGRTRECRFQGEAEYDTIAAIKEAVKIPVIANGDIDSADKTKFVMDYTGADAVMIGRIARGRPWIFREIIHFLKYQQLLPRPAIFEIQDILLNHVAEIHNFYSEFMGVRIARKHVGWYLATISCDKSVRRAFNQLDASLVQIDFLKNLFGYLINRKEGHAA